MKASDDLVNLLRDVGVCRLGYFDGCICCEFEVRGVRFDLSCGKGGKRGLRVSSHHGDYRVPEELRPAADEIAKQAISDRRGELPIEITIE